MVDILSNLFFLTLHVYNCPRMYGREWEETPTNTQFTRAQFNRASTVMMSLAWFGLVKNGHFKRDRANSNQAGPLGAGHTQRSRPATLSSETLSYPSLYLGCNLIYSKCKMIRFHIKITSPQYGHTCLCLQAYDFNTYLHITDYT